MDEHAEPLFAEAGASWLWLLAGPAAALAMVFVQYRAGLGFPLTVPVLFLVLVSGFLGLQIKAARIHTSVELTADALREGTEVLPVQQIVGLYPEPEEQAKSAGPTQNWRLRASPPTEGWQSARTLGELSGVPRGRTAIGLKLAGDRTAQAWARDHEGLRAALTRLVESR
ncbi:MAG: DUF3093 domain-containing protein [Mycobacterium sp.]